VINAQSDHHLLIEKFIVLEFSLKEKRLAVFKKAVPLLRRELVVSLLL
jgi:hypothetical protein